MPSMKIAPMLLLLLLIVPQPIITDEGNDTDNPTMFKPPGTNDPKMTLIPKKSRPPQVQDHSPPSSSPTPSGSTGPPSPSTQIEEAPFVLQPGTFKYHRGLKRFNGHTGQWTHRREREEEEEWKPVAFTWDDEGHEYWEFEDGPGVGDVWVALEEEDETQLSDSAMERPERHLRADKDCPSSVTVCDDEDESAQERCLYLGVGATTYPNVQTVCQRWDGLPAKIGNAFDNGFLDGLLQFGISSDSAYIGVEKNNAGEWTNSDGSPLTYKNWGPGEPYNGPGRCALMKTDTGKWAATECSNIQPYVCDVGTGKRNGTRCTDGWHFLDATKSCYYVFNYTLGGAHLTSIHSDQEDIFVNLLIRSEASKLDHRPPGVGVCDLSSAWIGLKGSGALKSGGWTDGSPVDYVQAKYAYSVPYVWAKENDKECLPPYWLPHDQDFLSARFVCQKFAE
ncbi:unnamed protein product, partial [Mesorhabditis spiculigera]